MPTSSSKPGEEPDTKNVKITQMKSARTPATTHGGIIEKRANKCSCERQRGITETVWVGGWCQAAKRRNDSWSKGAHTSCPLKSHGNLFQTLPTPPPRVQVGSSGAGRTQVLHSAPIPSLLHPHNERAESLSVHLQHQTTQRLKQPRFSEHRMSRCIGASKSLMQSVVLFVFVFYWCSSALHHLDSVEKGFIPPNAVQPDILCRHCSSFLHFPAIPPSSSFWEISHTFWASHSGSRMEAVAKPKGIISIWQPSSYSNWF